MEWTDKALENIYWRSLPRYKRPTDNELALAVRYFLLHYVKGTGSIDGWHHTLNILLLGLRLTTNGSEMDYILANEDNHKKDEKEQQLIFDETTANVTLAMLEKNVVHTQESAVKEWFDWCLKQLQNDQIRILANYFGCISLFLCRLIAYNTKNIVFSFDADLRINNGHITPRPPANLCRLLLDSFFNNGNMFAKSIVTRLTRRQIELDSTPSARLTSEQKLQIRYLQNVVCYDFLQQNGSGLLYWFLKSCDVLKLKPFELLDLLKLVGGFDFVIKSLQKALPKIKKAPKTWRIRQLIRPKSNPELAIDEPRNLVALVIFITIIHNCNYVTDDIWKLPYFENIFADRQRVKKGISIGKSIRKATARS